MKQSSRCEGRTPAVEAAESVSVSVISGHPFGKRAIARADRAWRPNSARFSGEFAGKPPWLDAIAPCRERVFELRPGWRYAVSIGQAFCRTMQSLLQAAGSLSYSYRGRFNMSLVTDRRSFIQASAAAGMGYWVAGGLQAQESTSPNEQIQVGCVGVGGKGDSDVRDASEFGKIYALCDVDKDTLDGMLQKQKVEHTFRRLPRNARQDGRSDRRGDREHARSHARRGGRQGDEDGQARALPEAADAHHLGSAAAGRDRQGEGRRHADGQPVHGVQSDAQGGLPDSRGPARQREGSSHLDEPARSGRKARSGRT